MCKVCIKHQASKFIGININKFNASIVISVKSIAKFWIKQSRLVDKWLLIKFYKNYVITC